ncbi:Bifunctional inhibitor/lipid-transfer protein/seed storage 2S albumin superfamily protein [Rhynchospora pubera]|uniref:Bifunctional inhibitor/lipid-transfer protein/seed storage 2S albumin superfamily protein n=1 Tax=Rhynchospora pubera TaxID=906938 RepID=A0AAV8DF76_9POAL|nr:Bifunctional inhibitor/lipid-transfer protein/seed storage 2S albumin superfamily protein [Rhynchospora pubera]
MAKALICFGLLSLAIILGVSSMAGLTTADRDCTNDMKNLATKCMPYVTYPPNPKIAPSKECCGVVQKCDMKCICDHITKEIEKLICMEKVVYVANSCGRPLVKGSKCGTKRSANLHIRYQVPPI